MNPRRMIMTEALKRAWCRETSSVPDEWSPGNPARGQCAVTALIVQDTLGGILLRTVIQGESHYFNQLPDAENVDLTLLQFEDPFIKASELSCEERSREYVLSYPATVARYSLLLGRFADEIQHLSEHYREMTPKADLD